MPVPTTDTTITDVLAYIQTRADAADLDALSGAVRARQRDLGAQNAANVRVGVAVTTYNLSPKYLNDLTGVVEAVSGSRADIRLDEASTARLRRTGRRFYVPQDETQHLLTGVPKACAAVS